MSKTPIQHNPDHEYTSDGFRKRDLPWRQVSGWHARGRAGDFGKDRKITHRTAILVCGHRITVTGSRGQPKRLRCVECHRASFQNPYRPKKEGVDSGNYLKKKKDLENP